MIIYRTIEEIKAANAAAGQYWFSPASMRWWKARVIAGVYGGRYFVTSEVGDAGRRYTVRMACADATISTVGEFGQYASLQSARKAAQSLGAAAELARHTAAAMDRIQP